MTEAFNQHEEDDPLEKMRDLTAQWANYFNGIQQVLDDYERLQKRVAALESENAALTDTVEQWKNNDEWSNRVTYDNVVDQIASLEDASKRDDARRLIEALLKKSQVTQFRRDIKHRVKELNEEGDAYSDKQVVQVLEACAGKGLVIDAKWKWAGAYWLHPQDMHALVHGLRSATDGLCAREQKRPGHVFPMPGNRAATGR